MDFTTKFVVTIDDETLEFAKFSWQESLDEYLKFCRACGFDIDEKLHKQIVELAKFRRVSL